MLPFLEEKNLYSSWNFQTNVRGNAAIAQTDISGLYCPTRRGGTSNALLLGELQRLSPAIGATRAAVHHRTSFDGRAATVPAERRP